MNRYRYRAAVGLAARARVADPDLSDELPGEMHELDMAPGTEVTVAGHDEDRNLMLLDWVDRAGTPRTTSVEPHVFDRDFEEC